MTTLNGRPRTDRKARDHEILRRTDVRAELARLGVRFAGPPSGDWHPCHAVGRDDAAPSAAVNCGDGPARGRYRDHGGEHRAASFFDLAAELGPWPDWRAARDHYAGERGPGDGEETRRTGKTNGAKRNGRTPRTFPSPEAATASLFPAAGGKANVARATAHVYRDADGAEAFRVVRLSLHSPHDGRDKVIRPVHRSPDGWRVTLPRGRRVPYRLPEVSAADADAPVLVVEGEGDADRAADLGFAATCNVGGAGKWTAADSAHLKGRHAVVLPDNDDAGRSHAEAVCRSLSGTAASVRVLDLPGLPPKGDLSDWADVQDVKGGGTADVLRELVEAAPEWEPPDDGDAEPDDRDTDGPDAGDPGRATVEVLTDEHRTNDAAAAALARSADLYARGGLLVRTVDREPGPHGPAAPKIVPLDPAQTRDALTRVARFTKLVRRGDEAEVTAVHPPGWCVAAVHGRGCWPGLRPLAGVVTSPVLRPDGTVLCEPGYDDATGLLLAPVGELPTVPTDPSPADARAAAGLLLGLVRDFPFVRPEHRAAWLAAVLTPLARPAIGGPCPLFLFDANTPGTGKGLLADVTVLVVAGRSLPVMTYPKDDDELRKRITALALEGDAVVLLDNIARPLGGASLDAALTATVWKDRLLGVNKNPELPLRTVWFATGNNVTLAADTPRRVIHVRLETPHERPEDRDDFEHPDLRAHVRANRGPLLAAGLTVLRAYFAAGCPEPPGGRGVLGSYEDWCRVVRDAVVWCGLPDPLATRTELVATADRTGQTLAALLAGLDDADRGGGMTAGGIITRLSERPGEHPTLLEAVQELCDSPGGRLPGPRVLGNRLRVWRGRVCGGRALDLRTVSGVARWFVRSADAPADADAGRGSGGSGGSETPRPENRADAADGTEVLEWSA